MKVMTFNLRVPADCDGINQFNFRKNRILEVIRQEKPDLIGFQEVRPEGRAWLADELSNEYYVLGCGRKQNYDGEGNPIAINRKKFDLIHYETFWLSDTPNIPGTCYENLDQSPFPRFAIATSIWHKELGKMIQFVNLHADHQGQQARLAELTQLLDYLKCLSGYKIITGDMNAKPDSEEIGTFLEKASDMNIKDASEGLGPTYHNFGRCYGYRIDYIFSDMKVLESRVVEDTPVEGVYYSDHRAVVAEFKMEE